MGQRLSGRVKNKREIKAVRMGKYQLDYKGQAQVQRFHEKHSTGENKQQDKLKSLRAQFLAKANQKKA